MGEEKPIYAKNTLEFVTVVLEFCALMEQAKEYTSLSFVDKSIKVLPLLYLKATLLSGTDDEPDEYEINAFITEETYEAVRTHLADLLGTHDTFLETFHPDINYSDTPIAAKISECLADVYQDVGNFAAHFRTENEEVMQEALNRCIENFRVYWGQSLLNALKALHEVCFNEELNA